MIGGIPFEQVREEGLTSYVTDDDSRIYIESSDDELELEAGTSHSSPPQWLNFQVQAQSQPAEPARSEQPISPKPVKPKRSPATYIVLVLVVLAGLVATGAGSRIFLQSNVAADARSDNEEEAVVVKAGDPIVTSTQWPTAYPTLSPTTELSSSVPMLIRAASRSSGKFDDPKSPEALAMELVRSAAMLGDVTTKGQILQAYAVTVLALTFRSAMYDTASMILGSECQLEGVTCNDSSPSFSRVTGIRWPSNGFKGSIPDDIGLLTDLELLDLSGNNVQGSLPLSFFSLLSLRDLYLDRNAMTGEIPSQIENMQSLQTLLLGDNQFVGEILSNIDTLQSLELVSLLNNHFSGDLPEVLYLPKLHTLDLGNNVFWGTIPWSWFDGDSALEGLEGLFLDNNYLTGPVPYTWDRLEKIETIILSHNQLTGEFPGKFQSDVLTTIEIQENEISKVSKHLCKMSLFRGDGPLSTLRTDCGTCSCAVLCARGNCVP